MNLKEFVAVLVVLLLAFSFGFTLDHFTTWTGPKGPFGNAVAAPSFPVHTLQAQIWTTTADFDAGTKSEPGDGNYGVETITDNLRIAADSFELSSLKGDSFTLADTDADTFKWDRTIANNPTIYAREISGGVLILDHAQTFTDLSTTAVISIATVSGDLDIRIKITFRSRTMVSGTVQPGISLFNEKVSGGFCGQSGSSTVDGVSYRYVETFNGATTRFRAFTCTNNVESQVGTDTDFSNDPRWIRITRSGTTVTWYYSSDGSAWTQDETTTFSTTDSLYVQIGMRLTGTSNGDRASFSFDDYHQVTGTVDSGGFRTSGSWTSSQIIIPADETVSLLNLTFSGLSSTYAIDSVRFYKDGIPIETYDTDIISGSGTDIDVTEDYSGGLFSVRITLKGDGAGTPVLESASVFLASITTLAGPPDMTFLWVLVALFVLVLAIGLWRSPAFLILAGLLGIILTLAVDVELLSDRDDLTRYGTFVVLIIMSILVFMQGALHLPDEFKREGKA